MLTPKSTEPIKEIVVNFHSLNATESFISNEKASEAIIERNGKELRLPLYMKAYLKGYDTDSIEEVDALADS